MLSNCFVSTITPGASWPSSLGACLLLALPLASYSFLSLSCLLYHSFLPISLFFSPSFLSLLSLLLFPSLLKLFFHFVILNCSECINSLVWVLCRALSSHWNTIMCFVSFPPCLSPFSHLFFLVCLPFLPLFFKLKIYSAFNYLYLCVVMHMRMSGPDSPLKWLCVTCHGSWEPNCGYVQKQCVLLTSKPFL